MKVLILFFVFFSTTVFAQDIKKLSYAELDSLIKISFSGGVPAKAQPYLEEGIERATLEFGELDSIVALFTLKLGYVYSKAGNYPKALELYSKGIKINEKIYPEEHTNALSGMSDLANLYNKMEQFGESEKLFLKVIDTFKKYKKDKTKDYCVALNSLGFLYYGMGKYEATLSLLLEATKISKELVGEKDPEYAKYIFNLAYLYQSLGRYEESELMFKKAGALWAEAVGKEHPYYANYLTGMAYLYQLLDKYEASELLYLEALELQKKIEGDKHLEYAYLLGQLSMVNQLMRQYDKAEKYSLESIQIYKDILGDNNAKYAGSLGALATLYQIMKKYEAADALFVEAIKIEKKVYGETHISLPLNIGNYGNLKLKTGKYKEAEELYLQSNYINSLYYGKEDVHSLVGYCSLGYLYGLMGRYEDAKNYYYKAMLFNCKDTTLTRTLLEKDLSLLIGKNFHSITEIINVLDAFYQLTQTEYDSTHIKDKAQLEYGYSALQVAIQISENLRNELMESGKLRLLKRIGGLAKNTIQRGLLLTEKEDEKYLYNSFSYAELNKSILLADAIKGDRARTMGDLPDSLIFYELELEKNKKKLEKEEVDAKDDAAKNAVLKKQNVLNLEIDAFLKNIKNKYPKYHALKYENITAKANDIQALLDTKTMLLEYFVTDSITYLFALTQQELKLYEINISKELLNAAVGEFRNALSNYRYITSNKDNAYASFTKNASWFYRTFVQPAVEKKAIDQLIVIADGELGHLPFEAFLVQKEKGQVVDYQKLDYLVNHYTVSYNYSATLWKENRQTKPAANNSKMLACAATYSGVDSSLIEVRSPYVFNCRALLNPLPAVEKEVKGLSEIFEGNFLIGITANEAFFKEQAGDYGVIHLAMHGILHRTPMLSSLAFTENKDTLEDNFLHAHEISKLNLTANLVVLSACETGYGKFEQGEGVLSLARSFMYAGVPSLVVSLWQVNDGSTAAIMASFYENLADGMPKDVALRQAKLDYIKSAKGITAHPAFWSPFIQLGDNRPIYIAQKGGGILYWGLGVGLIILALLGWFFFKKNKK